MVLGPASGWGTRSLEWEIAPHLRPLSQGTAKQKDHYAEARSTWSAPRALLNNTAGFGEMM